MDISEACTITKGLLKAFEEHYSEEIKRYENFGTAIEECKEAVQLVTDAAKEKEKAYEVICEAYGNPKNAKKVLRKHILDTTYASVGQPIYLCDHARNTKCSKESCVANGGPCNATTDQEFAEIGSDGYPIVVDFHLTPKAEKDIIEKFGEEVLYGDDTEVVHLNGPLDEATVNESTHGAVYSKTKYYCAICNESFATPEKAYECFRIHQAINHFLNTEFQPSAKYPDTVYVQFDDGEIGRYLFRGLKKE